MPDWDAIRAKLPTERTEEQKTKRKELFKQFDPNGNGYLSLAEVDKGCRDVLGLYEIFEAKPVIMRAFNAAKSANDKKNKKNSRGPDTVERVEFRLLLVYLRQYFEIWHMFEQVDTSDDRKVDFAEFKAALPKFEQWGVKVSNPKAEFKKIDKNGGGVLLFDEFAHWALEKQLDLEDDDDFDASVKATSNEPIEPATVSEQQERNVSAEKPEAHDDDGLNQPTQFAPDVTPSMLTKDGFDQRAVAWHTMPISAVRKTVVLPNPQHGVQQKNVAIRRETFGDNVIPTGDGPSIAKILFNNFVNPITAILTFVAVVSGVFEDWAALGICIFVILFVGIIGVYQEWNAAASLESLKTMTKGTATVIRDGQASVISLDELVIGDVVVLEQGTQVPADIRLFESVGLSIAEELLTGENLPVDKTTGPVDKGVDCPLGDRVNMAFRNTVVVSGRGRGMCVALGLNTEMGRVAERLSSGVDDSKTALQRKMEKLMYAILVVCVLLVIVVFSANRWDLDEATIIYAAAVAIAILPQSLVAVVAVSMALSVRKMAAQKCIVRKLGSLEVLDSVTDICSDKTGTLTQNKMVVNRISIGVGARTIVVSGAPLSSSAMFNYEDEMDGDSIPIRKTRGQDRRMADFFRAAALCGTTTLKQDPDTKNISGTGNPTEIAIQALCWKAGCPREYFEEEEGIVPKGMFPFDSAIKRMSAGYVSKTTGNVFLTTKGAPERVLNLCKWKYNDEATSQVSSETVSKAGLSDMTDEDRAKVEETVSTFARRGLRTICLTVRRCDLPLPKKNAAEKDEPTRVSFDAEDTEDTIDKYTREAFEQDLIFLGIVGIYDPPRVESKLSVNICRRAGIKVRMLTGDHFETATAIAKEVDIIDEAGTKVEGAVMIGPDFDKLTAEEAAVLPDLPSVVGRCSPDTKVRMIEELHRRGRVTAMTGDGFNDSPSIKAADIGCAMGSGTDVTKGVADFVITDDNFATIVKALAEGRRIGLTISKFVTHLLCGNMAETVVLIFGLGIQINDRSVFVLSPMQILWLNLFTSSPPAIGLSVDPAPDDVLRKPPNADGLFKKELFIDTLCYGVVMGACSLCSFIFVLYGPDGDGPKGTDCNTSDFQADCDDVLRARTTGYVVLYFGMLFHAYNVRFARKHIFEVKLFDNAWLWGSFLFGIASILSMIYIPTLAKNVFVHGEISWEWGVVAVALLIFMLFAELYKLIKNRVDPVPVYEVTDEEAEEEYRLFTGQFSRENRAEAVDGRSIQEMAQDEVTEMRRMQTSFIATM